MANGKRTITIGFAGQSRGNKFMARHAEHGCDDALIPDASFEKLPLDHLAAKQYRIHLRSGRCRGMEAIAAGGTVVRTRHGAPCALLESLPADDVDAEGTVFVAQGHHGNIGPHGIFDLNHLLLSGSHIGAVSNDEVA